MRPRFRTQSECPTACRDAFGGVKTLFVAFPAYRRLSLSHVEQKFAEHVQGFIAAIAPDQRRYAERVCRCWASAWSQIDHDEVFPHRPGDLELELRRRYWRLDYLRRRQTILEYQRRYREEKKKGRRQSRTIPNA
jgi:hypothetical protein